MVDFTKELLVLLGFIVAIAALCIVMRDKKKSNNEVSDSEQEKDETKRTSTDRNDKNKREVNESSGR